MLGDIPLSLLGYGSGWALVGVAVVMIFRGDLITRREARAQDRRLAAAVDREALKDQTISEFTAAIDTSNTLIKAVLDVAQESRTP